ncbi:MAG: DUF58 domain-containing protein [Clostridiales bacterium]|nr:DUF58 domain-containing protein [Clostridiales bacterium]MBR5974122.1 DUF58 domain-containing protein [Clostridiales bacterium]
MKLVVFLALLAVLAVVELILYRKHALDHLSLHVSFSQPVAQYGEVIEVIEVAENNKRLPLPFVLLKFESPVSLQFLDMTNSSLSDLIYREDMLTMKPFSRHTRKIKVKCSRRGYYSFVRVNLTTSDMLLTEKITKTFDNDANITILPERIHTPEMRTLLSITFSDILQRRTLLTDPFSFSGIREYQPWDPMRSINWTATARAGDFMVNQNTSTSTRQVSIFLNLEFYNMRKSVILLEKAISLAYSYSCELSEAGIPSQLFTNGIDAVTGATVIDPTISEGQDNLRRGLALARIDLGAGVISFNDLICEFLQKTGANDYIVVISPKSEGSFRPMIKNLKKKRPSLLWIMPCFSTMPNIKLESELSSSYMRWEVKGNDR